MRWLIFDTETTDLVGPKLKPLSRQPRVIEFAAILAEVDFDGNGDIIEEWDFLVDPTIQISEETTRITNIKPADLVGQPLWADKAAEVERALLEADGLVGHNLLFDVDMITIEFKRLNPAWTLPRKQMVCTVESSEHLFGRRANLSDLHLHLTGQPHVGAHRAMADVRATLAVFRHLRAQGAV